MIALFSDFIILYLISRYKFITLRQLSYYTGVSLGTVHSKILNLNKKNLVTVADISKGSRKKRFQYHLTEEGARYMEVLKVNLLSLMDSKDSPNINLNLLNKTNLSIDSR